MGGSTRDLGLTSLPPPPPLPRHAHSGGELRRQPGAAQSLPRARHRGLRPGTRSRPRPWHPERHHQPAQQVHCGDPVRAQTLQPTPLGPQTISWDAQQSSQAPLYPKSPLGAEPPPPQSSTLSCAPSLLPSTPEIHRGCPKSARRCLTRAFPARILLPVSPETASYPKSFPWHPLKEPCTPDLFILRVFLFLVPPKHPCILNAPPRAPNLPPPVPPSPSWGQGGLGVPHLTPVLPLPQGCWHGGPGPGGGGSLGGQDVLHRQQGRELLGGVHPLRAGHLQPQCHLRRPPSPR